MLRFLWGCCEDESPTSEVDVGLALQSVETGGFDASTGRLQHARAIHPTQQGAVERELDKACHHLDRDPGCDRWHGVLRRLSERLVAHEDTATSQAKSTAWPIERPDSCRCAYRYD